VLVAHDPSFDGLPSHWLEQATLGDLPQRLALPHFEDASRFDAHIGLRMMIAHLL